MATKMLVCPECASAVAPGRFACVSCGALLASVASAPRSLGWVDDMAPPVVTPPAPVDDPIAHGNDEPDPTAVSDVRATIGPAWAHGLLERAPGETDLDLVDEDAPLASDAEAAQEVAAMTDLDRTEEPEPALDAEPLIDADPAAEAEAAADAGPAADAEPAAEARAKSEPALDADPPAKARAKSEPALDAEPVGNVTPFAHPSAADEPAEVGKRIVESPMPLAVAELTRVSVGGPAIVPSWPETRGWPPPGAERPPVAWEPPSPPRAGAYLPPSAVLTTVDDSPLAPTSAVPRGQASVVADPPTASADPAAIATANRESRRLPGLDPTVPPKVVAIGAGIAGLGFLLPWAAVVIGNSRIGGYLEQWGVAGPGHPMLLLVIVALGAAASQVDRLPGWARPGLPAVILGGLLVGLVWPYLFGSLQPAVGVYLTLAGALVLLGGGLVDLWAARHATGPWAV